MNFDGIDPKVSRWLLKYEELITDLRSRVEHLEKEVAAAARWVPVERSED